MKLKKFLIPFLLCSIFCFIPKTYAASLWNWADGNDILQTDFLRYGSNCQTGTCTDWSNVNGYDYTADTGFFVNTGPVDLYTTKQFYGIDDVLFNNNSERDMIVFRPPYDLVPNYSYALSIYMCSSAENGIRIRGVYTSDTYGNLYNLQGEGTILASGFYVLNNRPFNNQQEAIFQTCRKLTASFTTSNSGSYIGLTINNGSSAMTQQDFYFFGYKITELGYTNFTTQSDINVIQQAVNQTNQELNGVKDEIGQTNDKLDNINDTLTDTNLNTGDLQNSAGWLPPGPVDSILNLPLSLYQNLLNTLQTGQRACPALQINIPYVDEVLTIPCLSDIFSRIDGLNVFWTWCCTIAGAFILFNYLLNLYKWVDATLTMRENNHFGGY